MRSASASPPSSAWNAMRSYFRERASGVMTDDREGMAAGIPHSTSGGKRQRMWAR
ncbi:MAG: hypothetical protein ACKO6N_20120 [Myxococcota bacterium]